MNFGYIFFIRLFVSLTMSQGTWIIWKEARARFSVFFLSAVDKRFCIFPPVKIYAKRLRLVFWYISYNEGYKKFWSSIGNLLEAIKKCGRIERRTENVELKNINLP